MAVERKSKSVVLWLVLFAVGLLSVAPFIWIVIGSFKPHLEIQSGRLWPWQQYEVKELDEQGNTVSVRTECVSFDNYKRIFKKLSGLPTYYFNTFYLSILATFFAVMIATLAAYGLANFQFRGSRIFFMVMVLLIMLPGEVGLIGQYELMFKLRLYNKVTGLLFAYSAGRLLLTIFIMRNIFISIPKDLVDSAMIDGASTWQIFWDVMIPIGKNGMAACAILNFIGIWNEFLFALTYTTSDKVRTLPVGIMMLKSQFGAFDTGVLFATVLLSFLPIVVVFIFLQEHFVKGLSAGAIKG